jgi:integrase
MDVDDKWISSDPRTSKLVIRFWVKGFPKQFFISTGLKDTKRNREIVRSKRDAIANDIVLNRFDETLVSYQFSQKPKIKVQSSLPKQQYSLADLWEKYTEFQSKQLEQTTIRGKYKCINSIISRLPTQSLENASKIRDYLLDNYSHFTTWESLTYITRCCGWAVDSSLISDNPFLKLQIQKPKKKSQDENDYRAFTLEQRDTIIKAFENHHNYSHYSSLIKLLFWCGCRHGEAFALTWGDVSDDCTRISIRKSCNASAVNKGTKNGKRRTFSCQQESRLQELLFSIRPSSLDSSQLIFTSKAGCPMRTHTLFHAWNKHNTPYGEKLGVVQQLAKSQALPYLNAYSTRHTFGTWAISSGISPDKVAYWMGDDVATVLKYYCHPDVSSVQCPDF